MSEQDSSAYDQVLVLKYNNKIPSTSIEDQSTLNKDIKSTGVLISNSSNNSVRMDLVWNCGDLHIFFRCD